MKDKEYRESFVAANISIGIPMQVRALRVARGLSQAQLAKLAGTRQTVISRLENSDTTSISINTLLALSRALDTPLTVKFEGIDTYVSWISGLNQETLAPKPSEQIISEYEKEKAAAPFLVIDTAKGAGWAVTNKSGSGNYFQIQSTFSTKEEAESFARQSHAKRIEKQGVNASYYHLFDSNSKVSTPVRKRKNS